MEDSEDFHDKLLANNSTNLSKSVTLPDRFEVPALSADKNRSSHVMSSRTGDSVLVKVEDESNNFQRKPLKVETVLNCETDRPNVQVHHQNHLELTTLQDEKTSRHSGHLGRISANRFVGPSDDESSDTYPGESTSIVSKVLVL